MKPTSNTPKRSLIKKSLTAVLIMVNIACLLMGGFLLLVIVSESLHPSPTGILLIALIPTTGVAIAVAGVLDAVALLAYWLSKKDKPRTKRGLAATALVLVLAVLGFAAYYLYSASAGVKKANTDFASQQGAGFRALKDKASASGYGFDMLVPAFLPRGYLWR